MGRYEEDGRFGGRVVPFDRRDPARGLRARRGGEGRQAGADGPAEITRPPTATRNPSGRVLEVLGRLDEKGVDLKVVMAKYGLPDAFPAEVEAEAARVPRRWEPEDFAGRTDFRNWTTVTVDPETARDHDDAISLDRLPNGHWLLAVHIADVAHYVREGSALDQEAYLRGTSVYFPDRVVPMLPHALSSHICSLVEGQDRLTQSVVLELDAKAHVKRVEFHDGVIKSAARMSYQQVQAIVDGDAALRERFAPLVPLFERMDELSQAHAAAPLRARVPRLRPARAEARARCGRGDDGHRGHRSGLDSMRAIEEFMLAANEAVAAELSKAWHGRSLPHPRAARPGAGGGVLRARGLARLPCAPATWRRSGPKTSSSSSGRSRASRRRSSCRTCSCAP